MTPLTRWPMMPAMASAAILLLALVLPSPAATASPSPRREAVVVKTDLVTQKYVRHYERQTRDPAD